MGNNQKVFSLASKVRAAGIVLAVMLFSAAFSTGALADEIRVMALKGPTAMGLVELMDEAENGDLQNKGWTFEIAASPDMVAPALVQGNADIAALPANLASVLYNNTKGGVQVAAINTLGVLYIVDTSGSIGSVEDLKGKTLYASGKGSTPEYALDYILRGNGIDPQKDLALEWKSEHAECVAALLADPEGIAMLPQPFVTTAQMNNDSIQIALDLTEEWNRLSEEQDQGSAMITGVAVVRTEFAKEHPEAVEEFLEAYAASVEFVNENNQEAAAMVGARDIVPEAVAAKALPLCNIVCITGDEMESMLSGYLEVLFEQNPEAVGGALPAEDFYLK